MSLQLQLRVVSQRLGLLLLRVLEHAAVVQLVNQVVLNVRLVEVRVALHAQHLLADSKHLKLHAFRAREVSGLWWQF